MNTQNFVMVSVALLIACSAKPTNAQCNNVINRPFSSGVGGVTANGPFVAVGMDSHGTVIAIGPNGVSVITTGTQTNIPLGLLTPVAGEEPTTMGKIAVAPDGSPWIVTDRHFIMHLPVPPQGQSWGQWQVIPGQGANDITVDANGTPWIIGTVSTAGGFIIQFYNGSTWPTVQGGAVRIAAAPSQGTANTGIWVVNNSQQIIHRNSDGTWIGYPDKAFDIGINAATGSPWVLRTFVEGSGFVIYAYGLSGGVTGWLSDSANVPGDVKGLTSGGEVPGLSCVNVAYFIGTDGVVRVVRPTQP